jgi:iron complex outermembrane recepter protein
MAFGTLVLGALALSGSAVPSVAPQDGEAAGSETDEIIVTAQKREERLQDVPAAVSAFGGDELLEGAILDLTEIASRVPGLFGGKVGTTRPQLFIRGIGSRQFDAGSEASIGIFADEVFLGRTAGALSTLRDIERVEILKGPQSTLYGRNTIGGAINIVTKKPTDRLDVELEGSVGNYDAYSAFAAISGPLAASGLKARIAAWRTYEDGYHVNELTGNDALGTDNWGGRLILVADPTSGLRLTLTGEILRDDGFSFAGESLGNTTNPRAVFLARPGALGAPSPNPYREPINGDSFLERDINSAIGRADLSVAGGEVSSILAYRNSRAIDDRDADNSSLDVYRQLSDEESDQISYELRFASADDGLSLFGRSADFIGGVYFYQDESERLDVFTWGADGVTGFLRGAPQYNTINGRFRTRSFAAFARLTWDLSSTLEMSLGGRYTTEAKRWRFSGRTTAPGLPLVVADYDTPDRKVTFDSFDPSLTLSYRPSEDLTVYADYSRGFKGGGFQYIPFNATLANASFRPERLDAIQMGVKGSPFARVTAEAALFYYDYRDLQVLRIIPAPGGSSQSLIDNAASSRIFGGELSVAARLFDGFRTGVDYAYTNAEYKKFQSSASADFSGTRMVRAPRHSIHLFAEQEMELGKGRLSLRGDLAFLSRFFFEPGEGDPRFGITTPLTQQPAHAVLDLHATYKIGRTQITAFANNVTDSYSRRSVVALPTQVIVYPAPPLTFGVRLGWSLHP